jgi:pimeloyl-ACP methyl ester carboxylesterase
MICQNVSKCYSVDLKRVLNMIKKTLKWALLLGLVLAAGWAGSMHFSAQSALDHDYSYTASVDALPLYHPGIEDGLVRIAANGMEFRARIAGFDDPSRPTAILLHGWPVTSAMYLDLIGPLQEAGYRVLVPDQRGYSPGARPTGAENYVVPNLTADVLALADAVGAEQFHLVGHDWGAVVGWSVVLTHPERVISWSGLSIAHPAAFSDALENDPDQKARSSYFMLFATPWLAETLFSADDFARMKWMHSSMSQTQAEEYHALLSEPGALTATFNWYRAMMTGASAPPTTNLQVDVPTVFVWGNEDVAVGRYGVEQQAQYMDGPYKEIELDAGHWLFRDQPRQTVAAVLMHIQKFSEK